MLELKSTPVRDGQAGIVRNFVRLVTSTGLNKSRGPKYKGGASMRKGLLVSFGVLLAGAFALRPGTSQTSPAQSASPQFTADGKLVRPEGYRRWVYASSGYGMSYSQKADDSMVMFTNVFVNPSSYYYYLAHANYPDKTIFVLDLYAPTC